MKFNNYARKYLSSILSSETKNLLLSFFYRGYKVKIRNLTNYYEVKTSEKNINGYTTDSNLIKLLNEIKNLKVGQIDYEDSLSNDCISYLNVCFHDKHFKDLNNDFNSMNPGPIYDQYVENRLEDIKTYCSLNFIDNAFSNSSLDADYLNDSFNKRFIFDKDRKIIDVIKYALEENRLDLIKEDEDGNIRLSDESYQKYIINDYPIELTTKEKIRKSIDNSYRTFNDYAKCNLHLFKYFVTLTFADGDNKEKHLLANSKRKLDEYDLKFKYIDNSNDLDIVTKVLAKFFNKFKIQLKRRGYNFYYLGVPEYHKNGSIHFHFLFSDIPDDLLYKVPSWLDIDYLTNYQSKNGIGLKSWIYGKSDIDLINDKSRVTSYIAKYMIKSFDEISESIYYERLNKQRFYKSNNLLKPIKLSELEYGEIKEDIENNFISLYERENYNKYTSNVTLLKLYQINDI